MHRFGLASLFACVAFADDSPVEMIRRSIEANQANAKKARQYTYQEYRVKTERDAKGKPGDSESLTWDIIALEGSTYRKLILKNGNPLSEKEQKKEDEQLRKEAERRRNENSEQRKRRLFNYSYDHTIPYPKLNEIYTFRALPDEEIGGRRTTPLEGIPKPGFQPHTDDEKEAVNFRLTLWLEHEEYYPVRIGIEIITDQSRLQKGTTFQIDFDKVNNDAWMAQRNESHFSLRPMRLFTVRGEQIITYSNFQKFQVDSKFLTEEARQP
jgi:hypothetical protein